MPVSSTRRSRHRDHYPAETLRRFAASGLFTACALLAGCRDKVSDAPQRAGPPRLLSVQELTEAEKRYGHAPTPNPAVTYQPDVVMLRAGAEAVRSVSRDGLVWTIDPDARGAGNIRPGTVLLLTSRAAGRVLGVRKTGEGLEVVLPEPVTGAINSLLRALNIGEEVKSSGGLETKPVIIVNMGRVHPAIEGCGA